MKPPAARSPQDPMATFRALVEITRLPALERVLVKDLGLESAGTASLDAVLMDTFDGRLVRDGGIVLRQDAGPDHWQIQWTDLDRDEDRGSVRVPRADRVDRDAFPAGPVTDRLARVLDVRSLLPLAHVQATNRLWERRDRRGKVVLRVRIESGTTVRRPSGRRAVERAPEIHLIGLRGFGSAYDDALRVVRRLDGVTAAESPWAVDLLRAVDHTPGHDPSAIHVTLDPAGTPRAGVRALATAYLGVVRANRDGTRRALDPEFLHDLRVAVRRLRTLMKATRAVWPAELEPRFRTDFRWLARATSRPRDLDVYVLDFEAFRRRLPREDRPALDPVRAWLDRERADAHRELAETLQGDRVAALLEDFEALLGSHAFRDEPAATDASLAELAVDVISRAHRRVLRDGARIDQTSPDDDLHALRKRAKELRYLIDGFGDLFPRRAVKRQVKALKRLQDNLGEHQDRVVQGDTLRRIAAEIDDAPAPTLVALGFLVEQLHDDAQQLRDEFAARFAEYAAGSRREEFERMRAGVRRRAREATA